LCTQPDQNVTATPSYPFMPRLHMQVRQPDTERKACKKVLSCCQPRATFCLWRG